MQGRYEKEEGPIKALVIIKPQTYVMFGYFSGKLRVVHDDHFHVANKETIEHLLTEAITLTKKAIERHGF